MNVCDSYEVVYDRDIVTDDGGERHEKGDHMMRRGE